MPPLKRIKALRMPFAAPPAVQEVLVRDHPNEPAYQSDLGRTLRSMGNLYLFLRRDHNRAEKTLLAPAQFDGLPPGFAQSHRVEARAHPRGFRSGQALRSFRPPARAARISRNRDSPRRVTQARPSRESRLPLLFRRRLKRAGRRLSQLGSNQRGRKRVATSAGAAQELVGSHPATGYYRHLIADVAYSLASLAYHERKRPAEARPLLERALQIEDELDAQFPSMSEYGFYLGSILRDFRDWFDDTDLLEAWRDRLAAALSEHELEARPAQVKSDHDRLSRDYKCLFMVDRLLDRYEVLLADRRRAAAAGVNLDDPLLARPMLLAQKGKHTEAAAAAAAIAASNDDSGYYLYTAAQLCARIVGMVRNDRALSVRGKKSSMSFSAIRHWSGLKTCKRASTLLLRVPAGCSRMTASSILSAAIPAFSALLAAHDERRIKAQARLQPDGPSATSERSSEAELSRLYARQAAHDRRPTLLPPCQSSHTPTRRRRRKEDSRMDHAFLEDLVAALRKLRREPMR